jgi:hypothetical protein
LIATPAVGVVVGTRGVEVGGSGDGVGCDVRVGTIVEMDRAVGVDAVVGETDVGSGAGVISRPTSKVLQAVKNNASRKVRKILSFIGPPMELPRIIDRECHKGVTTALQF